jgi:hypothetical protein
MFMEETPERNVTQPDFKGPVKSAHFLFCATSQHRSSRGNLREIAVTDEVVRDWCLSGLSFELAAGHRRLYRDFPDYKA